MPSDDVEYFIGSAHRKELLSKALNRRDPHAGWNPVAPIHAVDENGTAACGATRLWVFADVQPWQRSMYVRSMRCPECLKAVPLER